MSANKQKSNDSGDLTPNPPATLVEAFANTAKALQQFGLERIRIVGLSVGCTSKSNHSGGADGSNSCDGVRTVTEQEFMREFVFLSRPCIILDAMEDWPAIHKWRDDRYLFDLDHVLPSEEEREDENDDDDDSNGSNDDEGTSCAAEVQHSERDETDGSEAAAAPRQRGPKKVTVALTPNGRADAITYVLYDTEDVPAGERSDVYEGDAAKTAIVLKDHPCQYTGNGARKENLKMEKIFMYAAEVRVTLPELYELFARSSIALPPDPVHLDMRTLKSGAHSDGGSVSTAPSVIAYAQLQNNCLNTEYTHLHADLHTNVEDFGKRVFGESTEAANAWFGVPASVSSMHQDWVENLYSVVRGVKEFLLIPPWEGVFVPKPEVPSAQFALDETRCERAKLKFAFKPYPRKDGTFVPWMDFDVSSDLLEQQDGEAAVLAALNESIADNEARKPRIDPALTGLSPAEVERQNSLKELHPLVAYVHPGETLYMPAMWLHRVAQHADEVDIRNRAAAWRQTDGAAVPPLPLIAAVNYWYDMNFVNPAVVMLREFGLLL